MAANKFDFIKKAGQAWRLNFTTSTNLTGRAQSARLIVKKNPTDADSSAVIDKTVSVSDPANFSVTFNVLPSETKPLLGVYYWEAWTFLTNKTDALPCASGTVKFEDPLLDTI